MKHAIILNPETCGLEPHYAGKIYNIVPYNHTSSKVWKIMGDGSRLHTDWIVYNAWYFIIYDEIKDYDYLQGACIRRYKISLLDHENVPRMCYVFPAEEIEP